MGLLLSSLLLKMKSEFVGQGQALKNNCPATANWRSGAPPLTEFCYVSIVLVHCSGQCPFINSRSLSSSVLQESWLVHLMNPNRCALTLRPPVHFFFSLGVPIDPQGAEASAVNGPGCPQRPQTAYWRSLLVVDG
jgi:hypothetical protein